MTDGHKDQLGDLNSDASLQEKLVTTHRTMQEMYPFIRRIAIAIYDPETTLLKTYVHSSGDDNPLSNYQASLNDAPSLKAILDKGLPRVINNMLTINDGKHEHTQRIGRQGYTASYTMPMFDNGVFFGFIFFNSDQIDVFTESVLKQMDIYGHMLSLMVINELSSIRTLTAAMRSAGRITNVRDPETGSHLDRMSRYSRLIASELAEKHQLNDEYIEHIFMFSPLHDIGKVGIPDSILLKPSSLNDQEKAVMQSHSTIGKVMIEDILDCFRLRTIEYSSMLTNIAQYHHEAVNGSGYPAGLKGNEIPIEARIVAVADVFDALTSERPYKRAWSNEEAIATLNELAGETLDQDCVAALVDNMEKVEEIQKQFNEDIFG